MRTLLVYLSLGFSVRYVASHLKENDGWMDLPSLIHAKPLVIPTLYLFLGPNVLGFCYTRISNMNP